MRLNIFNVEKLIEIAFDRKRIISSLPLSGKASDSRRNLLL